MPKVLPAASSPANHHHGDQHDANHKHKWIEYDHNRDDYHDQRAITSVQR